MVGRTRKFLPNYLLPTAAVYRQARQSTENSPGALSVLGWSEHLSMHPFSQPTTARELSSHGNDRAVPAGKAVHFTVLSIHVDYSFKLNTQIITKSLHCNIRLHGLSQPPMRVSPRALPALKLRGTLSAVSLYPETSASCRLCFAQRHTRRRPSLPRVSSR